MRQGDPLDTETMIGAQASNDQLEKILSYIEIGKCEGATRRHRRGACRAGRDLNGGYYVPPTIFTGNNKMRVFQEEIFGPVVAVTSFADYDDAISIANDTLYGLGAGVWSRDGNTAYRAGPRHQGGSGLDELLSRLPGARRVRWIQAVRHRPREPQDDARPLPADQEPAGVLQQQGPRVLLSTGPVTQPLKHIHDWKEAMTSILDSPTTLDTTTDTMRAAVVTEFGAPLEISDLEVPTPGFGEALVKVETSGVCHTDLHAAHGDWPVKPQPPFVPGHEGYGTVVALGAGVDDLKVGDKVGNAWLWSACGSCEYCRTGWETLCESQKNGGYSVNGSFGTYMLVNAAYAPRIPDNVDPLEIAPILCAGVTVYKGLKVTDTRPGQWVAISGIGGLGHIAVQYARAMGLRVVAIDVDDSKLALATRLGAEVVVNASTSDVVAEVQKATGGVHGVLVTAVHPQAFGQAIGLARRGGTIVFNGLPPGDFPAPIFDIVLKGLTIRGSIVGTRQDMAEALDFYARGLIHPTVASAGLDDINDVFAKMERGQIDGRIVIDYRNG